MRDSSKFPLRLLALGALGGFGAIALAAAPTTHGVEYSGGRWFDGNRFVPRTMYVVDGAFRQRRPATVDSTVDLAGGYVVPPFSDAHQHLYAPIDGTVGSVPDEITRDELRVPHASVLVDRGAIRDALVCGE